MSDEERIKLLEKQISKLEQDLELVKKSVTTTIGAILESENKIEKQLKQKEPSTVRKPRETSTAPITPAPLYTGITTPTTTTTTNTVDAKTIFSRDYPNNKNLYHALLSSEDANALESISDIVEKYNYFVKSLKSMNKLPELKEFLKTRKAFIL